MGCLDDEGLLMVRQRLDVPPHSQPPGHAREVGPLNTNRQIFQLYLYSLVYIYIVKTENRSLQFKDTNHDGYLLYTKEVG